jgi:UDP-N-acetylglucosamine 1-carboxyvinyltransferase
MATLLIEGGRRLAGCISVDGNKNAALPLLAACLLTDRECVLTNVPAIRDVESMARLLVSVGASIEGIGTSTLRVRCCEVTSDEPDPALVGRLRGSVLLLGPLLVRRGRARLAAPGGDFPARRTITTHLDGLAELGARPIGDRRGWLEAPDGLRPATIYLHEASVTGTETVLLAAAAAPGRTIIRHAACEPHVVELGRFLRALGVGVSGEGTPTIVVDGIDRFGAAEHRLLGDYIEAGSWAVVAAVTGGEIEVRGCRVEDMEVIGSVLGRMRVACGIDEGVFRVERSSPAATPRITTGVWPSFPSDMVSLVTVLATQARGSTLVHDWLYELRLFALEQLSGMGADLFLCDPHRIVVTGPTPLRGRKLDTRDIRSGMALIAAALAADGQSAVGPVETVERGYAHLTERLRSIGAQVARLEDSS